MDHAWFAAGIGQIRAEQLVLATTTAPIELVDTNLRQR